MLKVTYPNLTESDKRECFKSVSLRGVIDIDDSSHPRFFDFYQLLAEHFHSSELEPFDIMQDELSANRQQMNIRFICIVLSNPDRDVSVIGGAYASVQKGIIALRFLILRNEYRKCGLGQLLLDLLLRKADAFCRETNGSLDVCFGECVGSSERFWNHSIQPPMTRLYMPCSSEFKEIDYELPHLGEFDSSGTPINPKPPQKEHVQLAHRNYSGIIPTSIVNEIFRSVWTYWYLRPVEYFGGSQKAWERHRVYVMDILENRILSRFSEYPNLRMLTAAQRE